MLSRCAKAILCLLVLLAGPLSGLAGRAEASLVLRRPAEEADLPCPVSLLHDLPGIDTLGRLDLPLTQPPQTTSESVPPSGDSEPLSGDPPLTLPFGPAFPDVQHGASAPDHGSFPTGAGFGCQLLLSPSNTPRGVEASGMLFLADDRFQPPSFPSRLFRPPRCLVLGQVC